MTIVAEDNKVRIEKLDPGGVMWANPYLVTCKQTGESVLVDTPGNPDVMLTQVIDKHVKYILMTHNHGDHISALAALKAALKVPVAGHELDAHKYPVPLDIKLEDSAVVTFGRLEMKVYHTPGHTKGSLCFLVGTYLLAGDTLFPHGPGHTVSPANFHQIVQSLTEKIFVLPDETLVFSGHGDGTVLWKEKDEFRQFSAKPHRPDLFGDVLWLES
ncbi:MAG: MBL fold metallo-hydrolase [Dehalococcoidia bacterium]|nr:MBL fold metallo-hydrolase [Dehalococcoidia bacterium]